MKLFWDVNVLVDLVDRDRPGHTKAAAILRWSVSQSSVQLCAWHTLSILDYLCTKKFGQMDAQEILREILKVFTIPATGSAEARNALSYLEGDYEDAMQIAAAVAGAADWLLTRDKGGFSKSPVPITTPDQFCSRFGI